MRSVFYPICTIPAMLLAAVSYLDSSNPWNDKGFVWFAIFLVAGLAVLSPVLLLVGIAFTVRAVKAGENVMGLCLATVIAVLPGFCFLAFVRGRTG